LVTACETYVVLPVALWSCCNVDDTYTMTGCNLSCGASSQTQDVVSFFIVLLFYQTMAWTCLQCYITAKWLVTHIGYLIQDFMLHLIEMISG